MAASFFFVWCDMGGALFGLIDTSKFAQFICVVEMEESLECHSFILVLGSMEGKK